VHYCRNTAAQLLPRQSRQNHHQSPRAQTVRQSREQNSTVKCGAVGDEILPNRIIPRTDNAIRMTEPSSSHKNALALAPGAHGPFQDPSCRWDYPRFLLARWYTSYHTCISSMTPSQAQKSADHGVTSVKHSYNLDTNRNYFSKKNTSGVCWQ